MKTTKILILGHSPSSKPYHPQKGNPSINRLNRWLDECDVKIYSFANLCAHHVPSLKKGTVDETSIKNMCQSYNKIIGLGNEVKQCLTKMGIEHFPAPHPSPLNRKFNDKAYELNFINTLKSYLQIDSNLV